MASCGEFGEYGDLTGVVVETGEAAKAANPGACSCQEKNAGISCF